MSEERRKRHQERVGVPEAKGLSKEVLIWIGIAAVIALICLPIDFPPNAEIVPEEHVAAKARIGAPGQGDGCMIAVGRTSPGGVHCTNAERKINLLRLRETRKSGKRSAGKCEEHGNR